MAIAAWTPGEAAQLGQIRYRYNQLPGWTAGENPILGQQRFRLSQMALQYGGAQMATANPTPFIATGQNWVTDLGKAAVGGAVGFLTGGVGGAAAGIYAGLGKGSEGPSGSSVVPGFAPNVGPCQPGYIKVGSTCVKPTAALPGGQPFTTDPYGAATMGQFGKALVPAQFSTVRLACPHGSVLGKDNLCYNKRDLRKDERKWVPGRKPLLTGGELNAISTASRAARRLKAAEHRLEQLGRLLPHKALPRRRK